MTDGGHEENRAVYRKKFFDHAIPYEFAEPAWHLFLEKKVGYMDYSMLDEQDRVTGYRSSTAAAERTQGNRTPGADQRFNNLPGGAGDDDDWDIDCGVGGESVQRAVMERRIKNL